MSETLIHSQLWCPHEWLVNTTVQLQDSAKMFFLLELAGAVLHNHPIEVAPLSQLYKILKQFATLTHGCYAASHPAPPEIVKPNLSWYRTIHARAWESIMRIVLPTLPLHGHINLTLFFLRKSLNLKLWGYCPATKAVTNGALKTTMRNSVRQQITSVPTNCVWNIVYDSIITSTAMVWIIEIISEKCIKMRIYVISSSPK
jgi:hypothetical protein